MELYGHQERLIDKLNMHPNIVVEWVVGLGISHTIYQYIISLSKSTKILIAHPFSTNLVEYDTSSFKNITQQIKLFKIKLIDECNYDIVIFMQINLKNERTFILDYINKHKHNTRFILVNTSFSDKRTLLENGFILDDITTISNLKQINNTYPRLKKINKIKDRIYAKK